MINKNDVGVRRNMFIVCIWADLSSVHLKKVDGADRVCVCVGGGGGGEREISRIFLSKIYSPVTSKLVKNSDY